MKSSLKNYRQSPRKVRLVADLIRGKKVSQALTELNFLPKRGADVVTKLIASAVANAENNFKVSVDDLIVKEITVDKGVTLKRYRPRARGVAKRINKRTSNINLSLAVDK
jgi:large subunit ribosomal protein L22